MAQVIITCPFCHAQNMTMKIFGVTLTEHENSRELVEARDKDGFPQNYYRYTHICAGMAFCTKCNNPVGLKFFWKNKNETRQDNTPSNLVNSVETADKLGGSYSLTAFPQRNNELLHLPAEVREAFNRAEKICRWKTVKRLLS